MLASISVLGITGIHRQSAAGGKLPRHHP